MKIDGVLGIDVLRKLIFAVDPDAHRLEFYDAAGPQFGQRYRIQWDRANPHSVPRLHVILADGVSHEMVIDSGMNGDALDSFYTGSLNAEVYDGLLANGRFVPVWLAGGARNYQIGGTMQASMAASGALALAPFRHERLMFFRAPSRSLLGRGYLSRFRVTFDFPHDAIYLQPSQQFDRSDFYDLSGMRIKRHAAGARVSAVRKGSPAATAGLMVDDVITAINGRNVREVGELTVRQELSKPGRHVLERRRGGQPMRVTLTLRVMTSADAHVAQRDDDPRRRKGSSDEKGSYKEKTETNDLNK